MQHFQNVQVKWYSNATLWCIYVALVLHLALRHHSNKSLFCVVFMLHWWCIHGLLRIIFVWVIKNEQASLDTIFPLKVYGKFFRRSRACNSVGSGLIWPKFELVRDFISVCVICKFEKDLIKNNREKVETSFSPLLLRISRLWIGNKINETPIVS